MNFLALIPIRDWCYLAAIAAIVTGSALFVHHERTVGAAHEHQLRQVETAQRAAVAAAWAASAASETQRREAAQKESDHEADRFNSLADAGHAHALSALDGLRQRAAAADARQLSGNPAAVPAGPAASAAGDLPADVLGRLGQAAVDIAAYADGAHGAGADAQQQYDSLNLPRGLSPAGP